MLKTNLVAVTLLFWSVTCHTTNNSSIDLPIVDLGYERHRALYYNDTGQYYNFSNIRYAAPPIGELRFNPPQPPENNRSAVQIGDELRVCPQALPLWFAQSPSKAFYYLYKANVTWEGASASPNPEESEDCLFLDVAVPQNVFERMDSLPKAPVRNENVPIVPSTTDD
jgi:Carboxylesterase family